MNTVVLVFQMQFAQTSDKKAPSRHGFTKHLATGAMCPGFTKMSDNYAHLPNQGCDKESNQPDQEKSARC